MRMQNSSDSQNLQKTQPRYVSPVEARRPKKWFRYFAAGTLLACVIILAQFILHPADTEKILQQKSVSGTITPHDRLAPGSGYKQWVNCADIRSVVRDGNRLYVGCLGGVLVYDAATHSVIDQLTETGGLSDSSITNMIKKGNSLYIGTQDGFTVYDLQTKQAKKISVGQGLINGANIYVADDGRTLWVGTFNGLSRYDTVTGKITNYTSELADNSTDYEVQRVVVTPNAVYVAVIANAYSPGSIARFDKASGTWERFGPASFGKTEAHARIDFFQLGAAGGKVFASNYSDKGNIYQIDDRKGAEWTAVNSLNSELADVETNIEFAGSYNNMLLVLADGTLYAYDPLTDTTKQQQLGGGSSETDFISADNGVVWLRGTDDDHWLLSHAVGDNINTAYALSGRPASFDSLLAVIDTLPLIGSGHALWQYQKNGTFTKLVTLPDITFTGGSTTVQAVPNTSLLFIFSQVCGQGCEKPNFGLYDYQNNTYKSLSKNLPEKLALSNTYDYQNLSFDHIDAAGQTVTLSVDETREAVYTLATDSWTVIHTASQSGTTVPAGTGKPPLCIASYNFAANRKTFKAAACALTTENEAFAWSVTYANGNATVWQLNKQTGQKRQLSLPVTQATYSPFPGFDNTSVVSLTYTHNRLWVATNRGLVVYDPQQQSWKILSVADGLVSNDINTLVVDDAALWVSTQAGISLTKW